MRIGVLLDGGRVAPWQAEALRHLASRHEFVVYDCVRRKQPRRAWRTHALYYGLNLLQARRASGRRVPLPAELAILSRHSFCAEEDKGWDRLPATLLQRIRDDRVEVLLKFGLGLLRVPPRDVLHVPILSFHHGDPRRYRGRPAGFWEMTFGEPRMGQMVQRLSNRLDAGEVLAFAETKVVAGSWKATLDLAYRVSPLLLEQALDRLQSGEALPLAANGRNYRLPSNAEVARVAARMATATVRRLGYGALREKAWRVSTMVLPADWSPEQPDALDDPARWTGLPLPEPYRFLADPFFSEQGAILAEAMPPDGRGVIVRLAGGAWEEVRLNPAGGHVSYPFTLAWGGELFLLPEVADWSPPRLYRLDGGKAVDCGLLEIPGRPHLLDPTLHEGDGRVYLFGNRRDEGDGVLRLWTAEHVGGPYAEHPASPILISPEGARMGGPLFVHEGRLYRAGQDLTGAYGDGLCFFRVEALDEATYHELACGRLRFRSQRGPHTIGFREGKVVFDHYSEETSLLAGFRRLRQSRSR